MFHYEPNIISNPRTHFGVWTPDGWKVHTKRWDPLERFEITLSGDGKTTRFTGLPTDFAEDGHREGDPFTDSGIYPSEPRVEYPVGRPRWAISHTYLAYPFADQTLYVQEYVWDRVAGTLDTFFREHVVCEEAVTDSKDGKTVTVRNRPLSRVVVGNKAYPQENSAVRGVWDSPDRTGTNYYTRDHWMRFRSMNAIYMTVPHTPVVNCHGMWRSPNSDAVYFDANGELRDPGGLAAQGIPLTSAKLASLDYGLKPVYSRFYVADAELFATESVTITPDLREKLCAIMGRPFQEQEVGFAGWGRWYDDLLNGVPGEYCSAYDFDSNGIVDAADLATLEAAMGKTFRRNFYIGAYYGWDWLSTGVLLNTEMQSEMVVANWSQGAGYDAEQGIIHLYDTPGPNKTVYVEYHYDKPADPGTDNIRIWLHRGVAG